MESNGTFNTTPSQTMKVDQLKKTI
uniref:Uncharacterized protein n=1 Tax=Rhizophora mucronata TaxID=61149 RepID=A0A2P2R294_RHIMU